MILFICKCSSQFQSSLRFGFFRLKIVCIFVQKVQTFNKSKVRCQYKQLAVYKQDYKIRCFNMAKKYKSTKLLKQTIADTQQTGSAFGKFANRLADSKKKKIQKLSDTQRRLMQAKKNNKMIKVSKKAKKFALLDQDDPNGVKAQGLGLTHKGINVKDLKHFDDVDFNESDFQNEEQFDNLQEKINFAGFEASQNLLQQNQNKGDQNKPKTQTQIYKQIIEKSKAYKMFRQQQYEQNFNVATELDQGFDQLVSQLKFRNKDQQLLERIQHTDHEYDKLMNELKEDERIVSNKIIEKNQKHTEKIIKKKNEQLNRLMKDSDDEDQDIRGWVDQQAQSQEQDQNDLSDGQHDQDSQEADGQENEQEEKSYDELDEVDLSSSEQEESQNAEQNQQDEVQDQEQLHQSALSGQEDQLDDEGDEQQDVDQSSDQDQSQQEQQDQFEESPIPPSKDNKRPQQPVKSIQQPVPSRLNPQKKVKLNFIQ